MSLNHLKMFYGFILLAVLAVLAAALAFNRVTEQESFGLMPVLTTLSTLAGAFAGWAFRDHRESEDNGSNVPTNAAGNPNADSRAPAATPSERK